MKIFLSLFVAFLFGGSPLLAIENAPGPGTNSSADHSIESLIDRGTASAEKGDWPEAIKSYEAALAAGHINAHLYYNLATARFRSGQVGQATALLLAARELRPSDPDIRANLKFVHAQTSDQLGVTMVSDQSGVRGTLRAVLGSISLRWWFFFSASSLALAGFLYLCMNVASMTLSDVARQKVAFVLPLIRGAAHASVALSVVFLSCGFASRQMVRTWGAVTAAKVDVFSTAQGNDVSFRLHEGTAFVATSYTGERVEILLMDGKRGYVKALDVRVVRL